MESSVAPGTAKRYKKALTEFLQWTETAYSANEVRTCQQLDDALVAYFQHRHLLNERRGERQHCVNVRAAVLMWMPNASLKLRGSARILGAWDRIQPVQQYPPCPYGLVLRMVKDLLENDNRMDIAVVIWICFHAYLRISECLALTSEDISLPTEFSPGGIYLKKSKTGLNQSVLIHDKILWFLFEKYLDSIPNHRKQLFKGISGKTVTDHMTRLSRDYGISDLVRFTPHSLRHGGATHDFLEGKPLSDIIHRGRWRSEKSTARYIQASRALLISVKFPKAVSDSFRPLLRDRKRVIASIL